MNSDNFQQVQKLKNKIDDIRKKLGTGSLSTEIAIPSIVVIGDQSSGKSSLLELLSGIDIPRATGICTRVPLELQLRSIRTLQIEDDEKLDETEYAVISMTINDESIEEKISLNDTSNKIEEYTNKIAGKDKTISDKPIRLTIYRENFVDLTLIDLPGLVHFDKKDPKKSSRIEKLVKKYIESSQCIMLNVVKCINETANTASLKMSMECDPSNDRTLIVLTHIDMLDEKESFYQKFSAFQQDFDNVFLVKNRTNQQNKNKVSLNKIQEEEQQYFFNSKNMKNIPNFYKGSKKLSTYLAQLQTKTMLQALPELKKAINSKYDELKKEKDTFPQILESISECQSKISILISQFFSILNRIKDGNIIEIDESKKILSSVLLEFYEEFADKIRKLYPSNMFTQKQFLDDLKQKSGSCRGFVGLPNELHPLIAVKMIRSMVDKLENPSMKLVNKIFDEIATHISNTSKEIFKDYSILQKEIIYSFNIILLKSKEKSIESVKDIIRAERRKPFTLNHYYMNTVHKMETIFKNMNDKELKENDNDH
eukprot:222048_1